jgi:hypothetical protein
MKTMSKFLLFLSILFVVSCSQPSDMLTVLNPDGSCYREFSENADDAFLMGDLSAKHNPFPSDVDSTWEFAWMFRDTKLRTDFPLSKVVVDSIDKIIANRGRIAGRLSKEHVIVFARRHYKSVEEMDTVFKLKESNDWNKIKVKHHLNKKFRWFYTYYTYRETYPMIETGFELPIENYMTQDEARFWFTGKPNILQGKNGMEIREYLGKIEDNYNKWITENLWNAEYKILLDNYNKLSKKPVPKVQLKALKDSIYSSKVNKLESFDMEKALNCFFRTNVFSELWRTESSPLKKFENDFNKKFSFLFAQGFNYKLILPGKIIQPGDAIIQGDTMVWKLTSQRLVPADYVIEAQSRKANTWAFILTGIIAIIAIVSFLWKRRK